MSPPEPTPGLRALLVAAVLAVAVLSVGPPVDARPPPHAVCGVCSDDLKSVAAENGVAVDVESSSLDVRVDRNGTGHWTARVALTGSGVAALRENESLRERIVRRVHERGYVAVEDPQSLATSMDGSTLVVEYEVAGMAHESAGGVYVVDFFYWHGGEARWFYLAADSMTMRGPPETVVTHALADATSADGAVSWTGSDDQYDPLAVRSHVVFAESDGAVAGLATALGIGVDVAQLKAGDVSAAGVPMAILAALVAVLRRTGRRLASLSRWRLVGVVLGPPVALGVVAAAVETLAGAPGPLTSQLGDFLFYLVYVVAGTGAGPVLALGAPLVAGQVLVARRLSGFEATSMDSDGRTRRLLVGSAVALLAGQWLFFPVAAAGAAGHDAAYGLASLVAPTLYFVPLALTRRRRALSLAFAGGVALAPLPVAFAFAPHTGMGLGISLPLLYLPWALVVAVLGTLAYASVATHPHD